MKKYTIILLVAVILSGCGTVGQTITAQPPTDVPPTGAPTAEPCRVESLEYTPVRAEVDFSGAIKFTGGGSPYTVTFPYVIDQSNHPDLAHAGVSVNMTLSGDCGFEPQGADTNDFFHFGVYNPITGAEDRSAIAEANPTHPNIYQTNIDLRNQLTSLEVRLPDKTVLFTIDLPDPSPIPNGAATVFTPYSDLITQTQLVLHGNANIRPSDPYFIFVSHDNGSFYSTCSPDTSTSATSTIICPLNGLSPGDTFLSTVYYGRLGDGYQDHPLHVLSNLKIPFLPTQTKVVPTDVLATKTPTPFLPYIDPTGTPVPTYTKDPCIPWQPGCPVPTEEVTPHG